MASDRVRVETRRAAAVPGRHLEGCRPGPLAGRGRVPARQVLGLRRQGRLGLRRLQRRVHRRPGVVGGDGEGGGGKKAKPLQYVPNAGFRIISGEKGEIYVRLMSYARYLNQKGLDPTYEDSFGNTKTVQQREDIQLNKFFLPFSGWFLTPKMRYYLYVWSSNPSQGDPAQVVGAGNLSYVFNRHVTFGAGITEPSERAQHRGPVPLLAGRRRPPDRGRVLPRLLHDRDLAEGRDLHQVQVQGDARQQPEHARRERVADRQHDRHDGAHAAVAADDRRVRPLRDLRRLRPPREPGDAPRGALHAQHRGQAEPARHERHREQPDPAHRRQRHLHARPLRPGHHRREGHLRHGERGRRAQVPGPLAGGRVLLALAEQLQGHEHRGHRGHRRTRGSRSSPRRWWCRRCCRCT